MSYLQNIAVSANLLFVVIPAKAGQKSPGAVLNSRRLAPKGRNTGMYSVIQALKSSRAARATQKPNCGSRTAGEVLFFARAKKSTQKKHAPDGALSCAPRLWAPALAHEASCLACQSRTSLCATPSGRTPKAWRCSGVPYGEWKTPPSRGSSWFADRPVVASRAPSKVGGIRETSDRARGALCAPGELGERPAAARRAGDRAMYARRATRGVLSFGDFWPAPSLARALRARGARPILLPAKLSLDKQRQIRWDRIWTAAGGPKGEGHGWPESKVTCRGSATHKYTRPQAARQNLSRIPPRFIRATTNPEIAHKTRDAIHVLDSRFRGNDGDVAGAEPPASSRSIAREAHTTFLP